MNFEESNQFIEQMEKNNKNKKTILLVLIICAIMIVVLFMVMAYMRNKEEQELKLFIDDNEVAISSTLLQNQDGKNYMSVRGLASMLGYSYQKGEYKSYTEEAQSCYLRTPYEIISMSADSNTITKYIINDQELENVAVEEENTNELVIVDEITGKKSLNIVVDSENETQEMFSIEEPIKFINDELYVSFAELSKIFSVQLNVSQANRIKIYSVPRLAQSVLQIAANLGYSEVSNLYENLTAITNNMLVVGDGTSYGVVSLSDGKEIISLKYDKIVYHQNTEEFFVTAENSIGIVDKEGKTIIKPTEYDSIAGFDEVKKLYLVTKNDKYGVINHSGDTVVYAEYDSIGIENEKEFSSEKIRNFNLLFEECIPVNNNGKVGIVDLEGNERLKCVYDSLGYVRVGSAISQDNERNTTTNTTATNTTGKNSDTVTSNDYDSVLTIPERIGIKGIVVELNDLYGIYDVAAKRLIIPCACSKIYAKTKAGVTKYYLEYNEQEIDLETYLKENNLISIQSSGSNETENKEEE